jgi:hypothetical protein
LDDPILVRQRRDNRRHEHGAANNCLLHGSSWNGAVCPVENDFDPLEVPKNALTKNVRPKLVALVGCVKRHIGKNKASPLPGTLLWQSN